MRKKNQSSLKLRLTRLPIKRTNDCAEIQKGLEDFRDVNGFTLLERYEIYRHMMECEKCVGAYSRLMDDDPVQLRAKLKRKFS